MVACVLSKDHPPISFDIKIEALFRILRVFFFELMDMAAN
jgi:hypothetical protein